MNPIKKIIKVLFKYFGLSIKRLKKVDSGQGNKYISVGENSDIQNLSLLIRCKPNSIFPVTVGSNSLINGQFVIENQYGKIVVGNNTIHS